MRDGGAGTGRDDEQLPAELRELAADYAVAGELGRGSSAVVYLARDRALDRDVAIKLVRAARADDDLLERTAQEARLLARLPHHPNIVAIYAVRRLARRSLALVMQHVPGPTLRQVLAREGALPTERAVPLLRDLARALHFAHGHGIVHRDVKPENVYVDTTSGRALLSDFGSAVSLGADPRLTAAGGVVGTPAYMSPEQLAGDLVDGRSDVYSLGLVGWEMLSGRFPWGSANLYEILYRQRHADLPHLDALRPDLPMPVVNAVEGALERDVARRWPDAATFLAALLSPPETPRRAPRLVREPVSATLPTAGMDEQHARTLPTTRAAAAPHAARPASDAARGDGPYDDVVPVAAAGDVAALDDAPHDTPRDGRGDDDAHDDAHDDVHDNTRDDARDEARDEARTYVARPARRRTSRRTAMLAAALVATTVVGAALVTRDGRGEAEARDATGEVSLEQDLIDDLASSARAMPAAGDAPSTASVPRTDAPPAPRADSSPPPRTTPPSGASRNTAPRNTTAPRSSAPPTAPRSSGPPRSASTNGVLDARCATPGLDAQRACLLGRLAEYDTELNRSYATLIAELRRREGVAAGGPDPAIVQRLRQAQRDWLVSRDTRCANFLRGREGPLWAEERARCLGAVGVERVAQLERELARVRAGGR